MVAPGAKKQRVRRNLSAFNTLIGTPATDEFTLPAAATLYVPVAEDVDAGTDLATINGRSFKSREFFTQGDNPVRTAGVQNIGYFERGARVSLAAGVALQIDTGLGRLRPIANGGS